ncbi:MAG: hypothetical protein ABI851_12845 [Saprospiraceae bacterium]
MKNALAPFGILILCFFSFGCPYQSDVPIDKPIEKINAKYLGNWEDVKEHEIYKVSKQNENIYSVEITHENQDKQEKHFFYTSTIQNTVFLNKWAVAEDTSVHKYALMKIEFMGDNEINIFPITENVQEQFKTSAALKKFISKNKPISYFFERPITLTRMTK